MEYIRQASRDFRRGSGLARSGAGGLRLTYETRQPSYGLTLRESDRNKG